MDASTESSAQERSKGRLWLLFIHQVPPKPDYLRVKVRRRLHRLGAVAVKKTVYALPLSDEAFEDFAWLRREVESEGGSAVIAEAEFVEGIGDEELDAMLETERSGSTDRDALPAAVADRIRAGRTWVTREGVHVDRIASAWLIRRFIDKKARFKFVPTRGYKPRTGEIRFDMFEAEYTHVGEECSFQTLLRRFALRDRALRAIGEVVHDIDCKDDRFNRAETAGTAALIDGLVRANADDVKRIEQGAALFDNLYEYFSKRRG
jgi:hypothetical protein